MPKTKVTSCIFIAVLSLVIPAVAERVTCYKQTDITCLDLNGEDILSPCNGQKCLYQHVLDSDGLKVVQNGFYVLDYDCPADSKQAKVQDEKIYSCDETGSPYEGSYEGKAQVARVVCYKTRFCAASCNATAQTEPNPTNPKIRIAYCQEGSGPETDTDGSEIDSWQCNGVDGECPVGEPEDQDGEDVDVEVDVDIEIDVHVEEPSEEEPEPEDNSGDGELLDDEDPQVEEESESL